MSVEQHLPAQATGTSEGSHSSFIIPTADVDSYGPGVSDNEAENIPISATKATASRHISQEKLAIQTTTLNLGHSRTGPEDDEPKSVIHDTAGSSGFELNAWQCWDKTPKSQVETIASSGSPTSIDIMSESIGEQRAKRVSSSPISPPPLTTSIEPTRDWSEKGTPRAQTRQDFEGIDKRLHLSSLEDIPEGIDSYKRATGSDDQGADQPVSKTEYFPMGSAEITALQAALVECWSLCNTLATLSSIHRERGSFAVKTQDDAWKSCWRLCQQLYAGQVDDHASQVNPTLDLCRNFCQTLFETRVRDSEASDSVLRVSFELNNHLYNTHDRDLPDAFRERTLDFYITLCHRLMKQRDRVPETDSLLSACWSLAEMLFSIRQNKKAGRVVHEELLGSAVQACWELCDIFREGWTQRNLRNSDRGTPRPSQATFTLAEKQIKQSDIARAEDVLPCPRNPETPTTIFEDIGTISPNEGPAQSICRPGQDQDKASHTNWSSNASSISGKSHSSERTSSTNTVITLSNDLNINGLRVLIAKAALNNGFQRNGSQSLSSFVKSLSSDAFGPAPWQVALLKHYKSLVAFEPTFQDIESATRASAMDISKTVKLMAQSGRYLWLSDLYRLVFGFHVDEGMNCDAIMLQI